MILAGGSARRLGGVDKALFDLGGSTILARVAGALDLPDIAISANGDPARFAAFGLSVLPDGDFEGEGPLAGVLAGLDWGVSIGAAAVLTVPGDTPLLPRGLAAMLAPPPACAASHGRAHHLVALWPVSARDALRDHLSRPGSRHVVRFADSIGMRQVDFPPMAWDPFLNVNTPAELAAVRALIGAPHIRE